MTKSAEMCVKWDHDVRFLNQEPFDLSNYFAECFVLMNIRLQSNILNYNTGVHGV